MFKIKTVKNYTIRVHQFHPKGFNQIAEFVGNQPSWFERRAIQGALRKMHLWELFEDPTWLILHPGQPFHVQVDGYIKILALVYIEPVIPN